VVKKQFNDKSEEKMKRKLLKTLHNKIERSRSPPKFHKGITITTVQDMEGSDEQGNEETMDVFLPELKKEG
jgi:hypothetical protein